MLPPGRRSRPLNSDRTGRGLPRIPRGDPDPERHCPMYFGPESRRAAYPFFRNFIRRFRPCPQENFDTFAYGNIGSSSKIVTSRKTSEPFFTTDRNTMPVSRNNCESSNSNLQFRIFLERFANFFPFSFEILGLNLSVVAKY